MSTDLPFPLEASEEVRRGLERLAPWTFFNSPSFHGLERIPAARPLLLVGNHTLYGVLDVPFLMRELLLRRGIFVRVLGDHVHFQIPVWGEMLVRYGVVDGTPAHCAALLEAGQVVLVFPGGGREVAKRRGEKYQLLWKERMGFARLAIQHGATVVPFAAVGPEDALDIRLDATDLLASPLGPLLARLGIREDLLVPIATGLGPTPLPRPERLYFWFGDPIPTTPWTGRAEDPEAWRQLRDQTRAAVERGIDELRVIRAGDPERRLLPRLRKLLRRRG